MEIKLPSRPSELTFILLFSSVIIMGVVAILSPNENTEFFGVMKFLIGLIASGWAGATLEKNYEEKEKKGD